MRIFVLLFFLIVNNTYAQFNDANEILKAYKKTVDKDESYSVNITYKIYKGHNSNTPKEIQTGVFFKEKDQLYTKLGEVEIINTPNEHLKINHLEKAILVANGIKTPDNFNLDFEELSKYLKAELISSAGNNYTLKFIPNGKITQLPFSKLIIVLNKKTLRIKRQTFYYYSEMNFSKEFRGRDVGKVKLEVLYKNYKFQNLASYKTLFNIGAYYRVVKNEIHPLGRLKDYEIVNLKR